MNSKNYEPRAGDLLYFHYGSGYLLVTGVDEHKISYRWWWTQPPGKSSVHANTISISSLRCSMKLSSADGHTAELISRCDE